MTFRDRIKELRRVPASKILPNPKNWREHPLDQKKALKAILKEVGFAGAVLVREDEDGELVLIDGHARQDLAGDQEIPVLVLDVSEQEADKLLLSYDPLSAMATVNSEKLEELLREVQTGDEDLAEFFTGLAEENDLLIDEVSGDDEETEPAGEGPGEDEPPPSGPQEDTGILQFNPDAFFVSTNPWDLPDLLPDQLAGLDQVPSFTWVHPVLPTEPKKTLFLWGTNKFPEPQHTEGGLIAFYVHDVRFESIWNDPVHSTQILLGQKFGAAVMPDFTLSWDWPLALQVYQIYRARWMARYWQEAGINIVPNISIGNEKTLAFSCAGIPKGTPLLSVQCRTIGGTSETTARKIFISRLQHAIEQIEPQGIMIYGGTQHTKWLDGMLPPGPQYFMVDSWTKVRDQLRFKKQKG